MDLYQSVSAWFRHRSTPLAFSLLALAIVVTCTVKANQSLDWSLGLWASLILFLCYWIVRPNVLDLLAFSLPIMVVAVTGIKNISLMFTAMWLIGLSFLWFYKKCSNGFTNSSVRLYFAIPLVLFTLIDLNSLVFSPFGLYAISSLLSVLIFFITYWLICQVLEGQNFRRILIFTLFGLLTGAFIYLYALGVSSPRAIIPLIVSGLIRPNVMGINPNDWAYYSTIGWPIALAFLFYDRVRTLQRCFWFLCAFFFFFVALITMARTAFVAILATSIFILLTHLKGRRLLLIISVLGLVVFIFYLPVLLPKLEMLLRFKAGLSGRGQLWAIAWQIAMEHPFSGLGPGSYTHWALFNGPFMENGLAFLVSQPSAHSAFFHSGLELGIFAPLLILTIFILFAHRCVQLWSFVKSTPDFLILVIVSAVGLASFVRAIFETTSLVPTSYIKSSVTLILMFALQDQLCHRYLPKK